MNKIKDLTGQRFGKLVAVTMSGKDKRGRALWKCRCDCGKEKIVGCYSLTSGKTKSCGCMKTGAPGSRYITYNGETHSLTEWARIKGMFHTTLKSRLDNGWTVEAALTIPTPKARRNKIK